MALVPALIAVIFSLRSSRNQFDPPTELKAGIFEIRVKAASAHVLAARVGSRVLLFDSGPDPSGKGLDALLRSMGAARADVTDMFITHGHWDHAQLGHRTPADEGQKMLDQLIESWSPRK